MVAKMFGSWDHKSWLFFVALPLCFLFHAICHASQIILETEEIIAVWVGAPLFALAVVAIVQNLEYDDIEEYVPKKFQTLIQYQSKRANYVLLIIDVQTGFETALHPSLQKAICAKIRLARQKKAFIVVAMYKDMGELVPKVAAELVDYKNMQIVTANQNSKADVVANCLIERKICFRRIDVCGVNHCFCVAETMHALHYWYKVRKQSVDKYALNCICKKYPVHVRRDFFKHLQNEEESFFWYTNVPLLPNLSKNLNFCQWLY